MAASRRDRKNDLLIFLSGVFSVLVVLFLTGASTNLPVGKYEMEVTTNGKTNQIYVLDTITGRVKWVDTLDIPFDQVRGD